MHPLRSSGKSRQAYYKRDDQEEKCGLRDALTLKLVSEIRQDLPRCGTDKLHFMLRPSFVKHSIKMGRDRLYELLGSHGLLIRFRKRKAYTTDSNHPYRKYPNLIQGMLLTQAGELWVSDITYIRQTNGFNYLSIVTDAYSHKIVGYNVSKTLHAQGAIDALMMASKDEKRTDKLIHHSDRGVQYCCQEYVSTIEQLAIQLSMTEKGDPYENAIAERVNGILKTEFNLGDTFESYEAIKQAVDEAVRKYNNLRIHDSCDRLTPIQAHEEKSATGSRWKPSNTKTR